jgi:hypothetical protein
MLPAGRLEMSASHDNFLELGDGERFEIQIKYRRKSEGTPVLSPPLSFPPPFFLAWLS